MQHEACRLRPVLKFTRISHFSHSPLTHTFYNCIDEREEVDNCMSRLDQQSRPYLDMVASHLRSQIVVLHNTLETIERTHDYEEDYIIESFKTVENELRRLRKFIDFQINK